jgi:hypothetical protein
MHIRHSFSPDAFRMVAGTNIAVSSIPDIISYQRNDTGFSIHVASYKKLIGHKYERTPFKSLGSAVVVLLASRRLGNGTSKYRRVEAMA